MMLKPSWWDYAIFNKDGFLDGVRNDTPPDLKKQYEDYLKEDDNLKKKGIKL